MSSYRRVALYPPAGRGLPHLVVNFEDGEVVAAFAARNPIEIKKLLSEQRELNRWRRKLDGRFGGKDQPGSDG